MHKAMLGGVGTQELLLLVGSAGLIFWVVALIDVLKRDFPGENDKLIWVLVVVLTNWLGALIYWFVGRDKGTLRP